MCQILWEHEAEFTGTVSGLPKPFPDMLAKKVFSTTASQESLAQAREWLEMCQTSHGCLESRPGADNTAKAGHRRQSARGQAVRDKNGDRAIRLSKSLLERYAPSVSNHSGKSRQESMSYFIRESACHLQRRHRRHSRLGIRYIWIDSIPT